MNRVRKGETDSELPPVSEKGCREIATQEFVQRGCRKDQREDKKRDTRRKSYHRLCGF